MKYRLISLLIAIQALAFTACEKLFFEDDPADDPVAGTRPGLLLL